MNLSNKDLKTIEWKTVAEKQLVSDLREARKLIEEQANTLLKIAQEPICSVCQGIKDMAKAQWEKSKEWI